VALAFRLRRGVAVAAIVLAAASPAGAQELLTGAQVDTGLLTFFTGSNRSVVVSITELGPRTALSDVRITLFDENNRVFFRHDAVLRRDSSVHVDVPLNLSQRRVRLRASIRIVGASGRNSAPVIVLESVDGLSLAIEQRISCALPADREGPVTPYCDGSRVQDVTIGG
jgi:hypothetical protein